MKFRNGMYLFATAIVAGTMGLASCSNEEDVVAGGEEQGVTSKVTLGVHVNGGVNKKASQGDVNLGGEIADYTYGCCRYRSVCAIRIYCGFYSGRSEFGS